jgi:hypothetical protein
MAWGSGSWGGLPEPTGKRQFRPSLRGRAQAAPEATGMVTMPRRLPTSAQQSAYPQVRGAGGAAVGSYFTGHLPDPSLEEGFMNKPGTGEKWWQDNQREINDPGKFGDHLTAATGRILGQNYQPTNTIGANDTIKGAYTQPTYGVTNAGDVSRQLKNTTRGENIQTEAADFFRGPNLASDYAKGSAAFFKKPTRSGGYADDMIPGLQEQGQGETNVYGQLGENIVGTESGNFLPDLRGKSRSESLYDSGNEGLNTFYDREAQKRSRVLTNQLAATGMFGSGETVRGLSEIHADLGASQARDMADLARQADEAFLGRSGEARAFSTAAGGEALDRMGMGLDADRVGLDRTRLGGDLVNQADVNDLDRVMGGADVAGQGDESRRLQGEALANVGHNLTQDELDRLGMSADTGLAGDQERRQQLDLILESATSADDAREKAARLGLDIEELLGDMTLAGDEQNWGRTLDRFGMASDVQDMFEGRWGDRVERELGAGKAQAGLVAGATDKISDTDMQLGKDTIENLVATGALTAQQGEQLLEDLMNGGALALQFIKSLKGGG